MIIDAHAHFWDPQARHHDWLAQEPALLRRFGPEDLDSGRHTVDGIVFVQADCRPDEALDEVRWVAALAASEDSRICGIVAFAPVDDASRLAQHLAALVREPLVVGVRRLLQGGPSEDITEPSMVDGVRRLAEHGLTFDVCVTHDQLPAVAGLIKACPETTFVLDHLGKPPVAAGRLDPWRADIARVAAQPNVVCKLSGLTSEASPGAWSSADLRFYLDHALEVFGPGRCLLGSDWPVVTVQSSHEAWIDLVLEALAPFSVTERAGVLAGNAIAVYGLDVPSIEAVRSTHASGGLHR